MPDGLRRNGRLLGMKIVDVVKIETNTPHDEYDPSYPEWHIYFDNKDKVIIRGVLDHGLYLYVVFQPSTERSAFWGSIEQNPWSDFTEEDRELIDLIEKKLDIRIPTKEEIQEWKQ